MYLKVIHQGRTAGMVDLSEGKKRNLHKQEYLKGRGLAVDSMIGDFGSALTSQQAVCVQV